MTIFSMKGIIVEKQASLTKELSTNFKLKNAIRNLFAPPNFCMFHWNFIYLLAVETKGNWVLQWHWSAIHQSFSWYDMRLVWYKNMFEFWRFYSRLEFGQTIKHWLSNMLNLLTKYVWQFGHVQKHCCPTFWNDAVIVNAQARILVAKKCYYYCAGMVQVVEVWK